MRFHFINDVVLSESKIRIMKAIHNLQLISIASSTVVLSESKIRIMKAIHNIWQNGMNYYLLCSVSQR